MPDEKNPIKQPVKKSTVLPEVVAETISSRVSKEKSYHLTPDQKEILSKSSSGFTFINPENPHNDYYMYADQTDKWGRAIKGFGGNFASSFVNMIGGTFDIPMTLDVWRGIEDEYNNPLLKIGHELQDWAGEQKIYKRRLDAIDPGDIGWWLEHVQQSGTSLGMIAASLVEMGVTSALTSGLGSITGLKSLLTVGKNAKLLKETQTALNTTRITNFGVQALNAVANKTTKSLLYGVYQTHGEALMEAGDSFRSLKANFLDQGYSEQEASRLAAIGASTTYKYNMPLTIKDAVSFAFLTYSPIKGTTSVFDKFLPKNKVLQWGVKLGATIPGEMLEEGYQDIVQKEGEYVAKLNAGLVDESTFGDRFNHALKDPTFYNAMIGGAFGSLLLTPTMGGISALQNHRIKKKIAAADKQFRDKAILGKQMTWMQEMATADNKNVEKLSENLASNLYLQALYQDEKNSQTTNKNAYKKFFEGLKELEGKSEEEISNQIKQIGYTEELGYDNKARVDLYNNIKGRSDIFIENANKIEELYNKNKKIYNNAETVLSVSAREFNLEKLNTYENTLKEQLKGHTTSNRNDLTEGGQELFKVKSIIDAYESVIEKKKEKLSKLPEKSKDHIIERKSIEEHEKTLESLKEDLVKIENTNVVKNRTTAQIKKDDKILKDISKDNEASRISDQLIHTEAKRKQVEEDLKVFKSEEFKSKELHSAIRHDIENIETTEDLIQIKKEIEEEGLMTSEFLTEISDKSKKIAENQQAELDKNNPLQSTAQGTVDAILDLQNRETATKVFAKMEMNFPIKNKTITDKEGKTAEVTILKEDDEIPNFSPSREIFNEEQKKKLGEIYSELIEAYQVDNFKDFIKLYIKYIGKEDVRNYLQHIITGLKENGFAIKEEDVSYVQNTLLSTAEELSQKSIQALKELANGKIETKTQEEKQEEVKEKTEEELQEEELQTKVKQDVINEYATEITPRIAHLSRDYEVRIAENGDLVYVNKNNELLKAEYIDNKLLLDPDKYPVGTIFTIEVGDLSIPVTERNEFFIKTNAKPFNQKGLKEDSDEYWEQVPLIIKDKDGNVVGFVHQQNWYNINNPTYRKTEINVVDKAKEKNKELRNKVRENLKNNKNTNVEVVNKSTGVYFTTKDNEQLSLSDASKDSHILITTDATGVLVTPSKLKGKINYNIDTDIKPNSIYHLRYEGNGNYRLMINKVKPYQKDEVTKQTARTVNILTEIHLLSDLLDNNSKELEKILPKDYIKNLQKIRKKFPNIDKVEGLKKILDAYIMQGKTNKTNFPHISTNAQGQIEIRYYDSGKFKTIKPEKKHFNEATNLFEAREKLKKYLNKFEQDFYSLAGTKEGANKSSYNKELFKGENSTIVFIDENMEITEVDYKEHLSKNVLTTNVISHNVGTEENPIYTPFMNPVINIELTENIGDKSNEEISQVKQQKEEIQEAKIEKPITPVIDKEVAEIINKAKKKSLFLIDAINNIGEDNLVPYRNYIKNLPLNYQIAIVSFINAELYNQIKFKSLETTNIQEVKEKIKSLFEEYVFSKEKIYSNILSSLEKIGNPTREVLNLIEDYKKIIMIFDILKNENNYTLLENKALDEFKRKMKIKEEVDKDGNVIDTELQGNKRDTTYDKTHLTRETKLSSHIRVISIFEGIPELDNEGSPKESFIGLPKYMNVDMLFNIVRTMLNYSNKDLIKDNSIQSVVKVLKEYQEQFPWISDLIDKLQNADSQTKIDFVNTMVKDRVTMKFFAWNFDSKTKSYNLQLMDTNSNENTRAIYSNWKNSLVGTSGLFSYHNEKLTYNMSVINSVIRDIENLENQFIPEFIQNEEAIKKITDIINNKGIGIHSMNTALLEGKAESFIKIDNVTYKIQKEKTGKVIISKSTPINLQENVKNLFKKLGINLKPATIEILIRTGLKNSKGKNTTFKLQFTKYGLFNSLKENLKNIKKDDIFDIDDKSAFINDNGFKNLARLEARYNLDHVPSSFRDAKKSISSYNDIKFFTQRFSELINDEKIRENLKKVPFSKESLWLNLLMDKDSNFKDVFSYSHTSLTALKQLGKRVYRDNGLHKIDISDIEFLKMGSFWNMKSGELESNHTLNGIKTRMSSVLSPTMSDKDTLFIAETIVLQAVTEINSNTLEFSENLKETLFTQLALPEINRVVQALLNNGTNIKNYNEGAIQFLMQPYLNDLKINGKTIQEIILEQNKNFNINIIKPAVTEAVINNVMKSYNNSLNFIYENNFVYYSTDAEGKVTKIVKIDKEYLNSLGNVAFDKKIELAVLDYTINSQISNANFFMLFGGDPAMYYKDSVEETQKNITKRLANQIAPRLLLENSTEEYFQLMIEDYKGISENIQYITEYLDDKEITEEDLKILKNALQTKDKKVIEYYQGKYPKSSQYFTIKATDAQEYTTMKEHLHVLRQIAKIDDTISEDKINAVEKLLEKNTSYKELSKEQKELFNFVFQPMKPLYTGQIYDSENNIMRNVYIKSSSFPLLPWVATKGRKLYKLRLQLEKLEKKGISVRASYQSANKVGSTNTPLIMFDVDGNITEESFTEQNLANAMVKLPRKYFGIQMDVPYDEAKNEISWGTQGGKILMSYIGNIKEMDFNGTKMSGRKLQEIYEETFKNIYKIQRDKLYDKLGIDVKTGKIIDVVKTFKALDKFLEEEATERNWDTNSKNGLKALLGVTVTYDDNSKEHLRLSTEEYQKIENKDFENLDDIKFKNKYKLENAVIEPVNLPSVITFNLPLWLNSKTDNIESLLTSIISNKVAKMKMPGHSYVLGSEVGWEFKSELSTDVMDQVIYLPGYEGGKLKNSYISKDGVFHPAQVLLPSKLKDNKGNLIDLLEEEGKYFEVINGRKYLKTDMFSPDILNQISFRIPTSKLSSLASIEVVGFLPKSQGDLIIVPKDFIVQKGLDYDVDKEYTYQKYTYVTKEGKIIPYKKTTKELQTIYEDILFLEKYIEESDIKDFTDIIKNIRKEFEYNVKEAVFEGVKIKQLKKDVSILNYLKEEYQTEDIEEILNILKEKVAELESFDIKNDKNKLIDIHQAVLSHPKVQKYVLESLSLSFAREEAKYFEKFTEKSEATILDSLYQSQQMTNAASSQIGVGAYSLDVILQGTLTLLKDKGKPISLATLPNNEGERYEIKFNIGGQVSQNLGQLNTIDGERTIPEVISERQNISVDDANEGIMYRINLNNRTFDFDKAMIMLGYDKQDGHSVSFSILNQPIIKDFVKIMNRVSAVSNHEFISDKHSKTISTLFNKYKTKDIENTSFEDYSEEYSNDIKETLAVSNHDYLMKNIKNPNSKDQLAYLDLFLKMSNIGKNLREISTSLNIDSQGIGISLLEAQNKLDTIVSKIITPNILFNIENIYGDTRFKNITDDITTDLAEGYIEIGIVDNVVVLVKPNTIQTMSSLNALLSANIWSKYYPYENADFQFYKKLILNNLNADEHTGEELSNFEVEVIREMFESYRMYHFTHRNNNLYNIENIDELRKNLVKDFDRNTSLGTYFLNLKNAINNESVPQYIKDNIETHIIKNDLLKMFEVVYDKNYPGVVTIEYSDADSKNFNEDNLHNAIIEMYNKDLPLIQKDGKDYTTKDFVDDLYKYAYLQGGVQKAIEFVKYLPNEILIHKKFTEFTRSLNTKLQREEMSGEYLGIENKYNIPPFVTQFFQHNPNRVAKLTIEDIKKKNPDIKTNDISKVKSFKIENGKLFYAIYNKFDKEGKFDLFKYNVETNSYERIPTYTYFKINQYNANTKNFNRPSITTKLESQKNETFENSIKINNNNDLELTKNNVTEIFRKTNKTDNDYRLHEDNLLESLRLMQQDNVDAGFNEILTILLPIIESEQDSITFFTGTNPTTITQEGFYYKNFAYVSDKVFNSDKREKQRLVIHEILHSVLLSEISKYLDRDGNILKGVENIPIPIKRLGLLYQDAKKQILPDSKKDTDIKNQASKEYFTEEQMLNYAFDDVHEFITAIMTEKPFQAKLNTIKYSGTNLTMYEKFKQLVDKVINYLAKQLDLIPENITAQSIATVLEILEVKQDIIKEKINKTPLEEIMEQHPMPEETESPYITLNPVRIKEGVSELFESNPELANTVYKTLRFENSTNPVLKISGEFTNELDKQIKRFPNLFKNIGLIISLQELGKIINEQDYPILSKFVRRSKVSTASSIFGFVDGFRNIEKEAVEEEKRLLNFLGIDNTKDVIFFNQRGTNHISEEDAEIILHEAAHSLPALSNGELLTDEEWDKIYKGTTHLRGGDNFGRYNYIPYARKNPNIETLPVLAGLRGYANDSIFSKRIIDLLDSFEQITPQQKKQAQQLYSQYLDTIFPDSKVKDIVYHGTGSNIKIESFDKSKLGINTGAKSAKLGFFFGFSKYNSLIYTYKEETPKGEEGFTFASELSKAASITLGLIEKNSGRDNLDYIEASVGIKIIENIISDFRKGIKTLSEAKQSLRRLIEKPEIYLRNNNNVYSVILNIKNLAEHTQTNNDFRDKNFAELINKSEELGYDGVIIRNTKDPLPTDVFVVFEPEQIHILGGKQDIEGFKEFVSDDISFSPSRIIPMSRKEMAKELGLPSGFLSKNVNREEFKRINSAVNKINNKFKAEKIEEIYVTSYLKPPIMTKKGIIPGTYSFDITKYDASIDLDAKIERAENKEKSTQELRAIKNKLEYEQLELFSPSKQEMINFAQKNNIKPIC